MSENGWDEYQKLVLAKLEEHGAHLESLAASMALNAVDHEKIRGEFKALRSRAGIWGMIAGALPSVIAVGYILLKG